VRQRIKEDHLREGEARGLLVLVDAYADVFVEPDRRRIATGRPGTGRDALAAPAHLFAAAPVERGAVIPLARQTEHLRTEGPEIDRHAGQADAHGLDRLAHNPDRGVGQATGPDAEKKPAAATLHCLL
jgi:hypothetical protein